MLITKIIDANAISDYIVEEGSTVRYEIPLEPRRYIGIFVITYDRMAWGSGLCEDITATANITPEMNTSVMDANAKLFKLSEQTELVNFDGFLNLIYNYETAIHAVYLIYKG